MMLTCVTLIFDLTHDIDIGFSKSHFEIDHISGIISDIISGFVNFLPWYEVVVSTPGMILET